MLGTMVAGAYTSLYTAPSDSARSLGMTQEGFRLRWQYNTDDVDNTDTYGQGTWIEGFYQGLNFWVGGVFKEYIQGSLNAVLPYQSTGGALFAPTGVNTFKLGVVGRAASAVGGQLVLTATAGTPAASSPASATFALVIQDKGNPVELLLGPTHRMLAFMLRVIPTTSSGTLYMSTT